MNRDIGKTRIQYTILTPDVSYSQSTFYLELFEKLREYPQDLNQLINSIEHFEYLDTFRILGGINIFTFNASWVSGDAKEFHRKFVKYSKLFNDSLIKVFLIDKKSKDILGIIESINLIPFSFFTVIEEENIEQEFDSKKYFRDANDLIGHLKSIKNEIANELGDIYKTDWSINKPKSYFYWNPVYKSSYTLTNYFILNQILGNHWIQDYKELKEIDLSKEKLQPNERVSTIVNQVKCIDAFTTIRLEQKAYKPLLPFQPTYAPIILVAPYSFPRMDKLVESYEEKKDFYSIYQCEQELDYTFGVSRDAHEKKSIKEIGSILGALDHNLRFLENVGYLHSLFSYSPLIRLPSKGKSINQDLHYLESSIVRSKAKDIERFGKKLSSLILKNDISKLLLERNGQIVALSDLPIEWLYLDKYPLCLTHDVCRIPTHNTNSLINCYIQNQRFSYSIPRDLIKKTLIIHCSSTDDQIMKDRFNFLNTYKQKLGFESIHCSSIMEIKEAVLNYKPDLLIFDSHGYASEEELESYIIIDAKNNIKLSGDDIIKNEISAPIVFLSACSTMPNYGYVRFLSDAFIEKGAFVVNSTFNPIEINSATTFLFRLLNKVFLFQEQIIHTNWLEFTSHLFRSAFVHDLKRIQLKHSPENRITDKEFTMYLTRMMSFHDRIKALEDMLKDFNKKNKVTLKYTDFEIDWMSYTSIGRSDLIYFQSWLEESAKIQFSTSKDS